MEQSRFGGMNLETYGWKSYINWVKKACPNQTT
jgi:hypothetical protein